MPIASPKDFKRLQQLDAIIQTQPKPTPSQEKKTIQSNIIPKILKTELTAMQFKYAKFPGQNILIVPTKVGNIYIRYMVYFSKNMNGDKIFREDKHLYIKYITVSGHDETIPTKLNTHFNLTKTMRTNQEDLYPKIIDQKELQRFRNFIAGYVPSII